MLKTHHQLYGQLIALLLTLPLAQLQQQHSTTTYHNNNLTICNGESSAAKTIFEFWHESSDGCEYDANNLFQIHKKLLVNLENHNNDKITEMLSAHVSTSLRELLFNQITATISTKSMLKTKPELDKIINDLYREDKKFILNLWQQALDEAALFIDIKSIIEQILLIEKNKELKLDLLLYFIDKYGEVDYQNDQHLMPLLAYGITSIEKEILLQNKTPYENLTRALQKLPEPLLILYQSWSYNISLLNRHYNDYIYAEREIGPSASKRYIFTFMPNQNKFKFKGFFRTQTNSKGLLAIGAFYRPAYQYLTAEDHTAFISLNGLAEGEAQWWQVLWPLENQEFILLKNVATKELLCATGQYNEKLLLISMLAEDKHRNNLACQWKVTKRFKK